MKPTVRVLFIVALGAAITGIVSVAAFAAAVTPELVPGATNHTCSEFAGAGQAWTETKVDPPANGTVTTSAGTITISALTDTSFAWSSSFGIDAVFVKSGSGGSNLYRYDPPAESFGDSDLTTPGSVQEISHISFCWDTGASPSPSVSVSPVVSVSPTVSVSPATVLGKKLAATGTTGPVLPGVGLVLFVGGLLMTLLSSRGMAPKPAPSSRDAELAAWLDEYRRRRPRG